MLHDGAAAARVTRCRELIETRLECSRESLLNIVERSISAEREREFAGVGGPPKVLRTENGREPISQALRSFSAGKVGLSYISLGRRGATARSYCSATGYEGSASPATTGSSCPECYFELRRQTLSKNSGTIGSEKW